MAAWPLPLLLLRSSLTTTQCLLEPCTCCMLVSSLVAYTRWRHTCVFVARCICRSHSSLPATGGATRPTMGCLAAFNVFAPSFTCFVLNPSCCVLVAHAMQLHTEWAGHGMQATPLQWSKHQPGGSGLPRGCVGVQRCFIVRSRRINALQGSSLQMASCTNICSQQESLKRVCV